MKNLLIAQKFLFVAVAVSIPVVVLSYFFIADKNRSIELTRAELDGTQYLRPLRKLALDVAAHRDLASAVLAGDASYKPELDKLTATIDDDFKDLAETQAKRELAAPEDVQSVQADWQAIKAKVAATTREESFEQHAHYLAKIGQFAALIANESNLVLDSDVDSHYLIDALVFKLPKLDTEISNARALGAAFTAWHGQGDKASPLRGELAASAVKINDALYETNHFIRFAVGKAHPLTEEALGAQVASNIKAVNAFSTILVEKVVNGSGESVPLKDYFAAASAPLDATGKLWSDTVEELDRLLDERLTGLHRSVEIELFVVGLAMILTVGFLFLVARAIVKPIKHLSEVADRISLGELDAIININSNDEIGELGERFRRMQVSLKGAMDALERRDEGSQ